MQIKLGELKNAEPALNKLATAQLPIRTSFKVKKMLRSISGDLQDFEAKRIELVKKYGEANDKGDTQVKPDNLPSFLKDMQDLSDVTINVDVDKVKLSDLGSVEFSAVELMGLEQFVEDDISCEDCQACPLNADCK